MTDDDVKVGRIYLLRVPPVANASRLKEREGEVLGMPVKVEQLRVLFGRTDALISPAGRGGTGSQWVTTTRLSPKGG